jgi:thioredoxin 1
LLLLHGLENLLSDEENKMKTITKASFSEDVLKSEKPVLLDVWAPWCAPCRGMEPVIEKLSEEVKDTAVVAKLNASEEMDLVQELGVTGLPTFLVFKDGKVVATHVGVTSKDNLQKLILKA